MFSFSSGILKSSSKFPTNFTISINFCAIPFHQLKRFKHISNVSFDTKHLSQMSQALDILYICCIDLFICCLLAHQLIPLCFHICIFLVCLFCFCFSFLFFTVLLLSPFITFGIVPSANDGAHLWHA